MTILLKQIGLSTYLTNKHQERLKESLSRAQTAYCDRARDLEEVVFQKFKQLLLKDIQQQYFYQLRDPKVLDTVRRSLYKMFSDDLINFDLSFFTRFIQDYTKKIQTLSQPEFYFDDQQAFQILVTNEAQIH